MRITRIAAIAVLSVVLVSTFACSSSSHQELTVTPTSQPSISDTQFISLERGTQRDDGKWISNRGHISGQIQNIGNVYISGVTITVDWYTLRNTYLRTDNQTIYSLSPNEIREFDIYYNGTGVSMNYPIDNVYISNIW